MKRKKYDFVFVLKDEDISECYKEIKKSDNIILKKKITNIKKLFDEKYFFLNKGSYKPNENTAEMSLEDFSNTVNVLYESCRKINSSLGGNEDTLNISEKITSIQTKKLEKQLEVLKRMNREQLGFIGKIKYIGVITFIL